VVIFVTVVFVACYDTKFGILCCWMLIVSRVLVLWQIVCRCVELIDSRAFGNHVRCSD